MASLLRGINYLLHNRIQFCDSIVRNFFGWLPDRLFLSIRYRLLMGHWINWDNPITFTEKIQWLKVYNRKPVYTNMVDKYDAKRYVADRIGEEYIIPTLGVWNDVNEIDWDMLPNQFVLKTTHGGGGGGVVICKNKDVFDIQLAFDKINKSLASDIYSNFREWPYKNVKRRIIAEKYISAKKNSTDISNDSGQYEEEGIRDYKFFCFNGKVKFFKVDFGRFVEHHANYYSPEGNLLDFGELDFAPVPNAKVELPQNLMDMIELAEQLSDGEPFLRVDFYNVDGKIFFGELTFYPASGMGKWTSDDVDKQIGLFLRLDNNTQIL